MLVPALRLPTPSTPSTDPQQQVAASILLAMRNADAQPSATSLPGGQPLAQASAHADAAFAELFHRDARLATPQVYGLLSSPHRLHKSLQPHQSLHHAFSHPPSLSPDLLRTKLTPALREACHKARQQKALILAHVRGTQALPVACEVRTFDSDSNSYARMLVGRTVVANHLSATQSQLFVGVMNRVGAHLLYLDLTGTAISDAFRSSASARLDVSRTAAHPRDPKQVRDSAYEVDRHQVACVFGQMVNLRTLLLRGGNIHSNFVAALPLARMHLDSLNISASRTQHLQVVGTDAQLNHLVAENLPCLGSQALQQFLRHWPWVLQSLTLRRKDLSMAQLASATTRHKDNPLPFPLSVVHDGEAFVIRREGSR